MGVSRFPTTLSGEALSSALSPERRFDSKTAGDLSKVTQLVLNLQPSPWPPSPASLPQTPRALSAPAWLQSPRGAGPWRPLDGSLGLRRAARAARGLSGRRRHAPDRLASRAAPREAPQLVPRPEVAGSMRPKEESCWKAVQDPLPGLERGLAPGFPGAGSEGSGSAAGRRALPAPGQPPGQCGTRVQGLVGPALEAKRGEIGGRRSPGLTRSGPLDVTWG